jgi:hypothetical protein
MTPARPVLLCEIDTWSAAAADGYGSTNLDRFPPSLPELEAARGYIDLADAGALVDEAGLGDAWDALVEISGSPERALLLDSRYRAIRARRETQADALLARALGVQP